MNSDRKNNRDQRSRKTTDAGRRTPAENRTARKSGVVPNARIRKLTDDSASRKRNTSQPSSQVKRSFKSYAESDEYKEKRARLAENRRTARPAYSSDKTFKNDDARKFTRKPERKKKSPARRTDEETNQIRLNRFIAQSGICSRREADAFISAGLVSVNGKVVTEMGVKISPEDVVKYNGETIRSEKKVYVLLNKPKDFVTSNDDEQGRKTVIDLLGKTFHERVFPVGRLDRNTTGVLLLTNDGDLAGKLTHPRYNKKKIYHVSLDKNLRREDMVTIVDGVNLEDGPFVPDSISYVDPQKKSEVGIEIHSGRNRIVRRLFEYFGYKVIKLDRVYFAGLTKKNLPRGRWRFLTEREVNMLKMNAYE